MNADAPADIRSQLCPRCGRKLPVDRPGQLCPYCLLSAAVSEPTSAAPSVDRFVPPEPGELQAFFPQLEIGPMIGHGGMGAVYRARQRSLGRDVALKVLPPEVAATEGFSDRFTREARALARLSHPHVVAVFDHGTAGPYAFLVMELIEGINLRQLMAGGPLPPEEALRIVPQLCDALQYAHRQGVIHRDIKPENILIDEAGRVKITDFGLAKLVASDDDRARTGTQQVMGTLHYMAPEQFERPREVDHRADLYSLGVVFYELLTGELPLGRFDPPSRRSSAGRQVDHVVLKSLEKDPNRRYASADAVRSDLDRVRSARKSDRWTRAAQQIDQQARQAGHRVRSAAEGALVDWLQFGTILLHVIFYALVIFAIGAALDGRGIIEPVVGLLWVMVGLWIAARFVSFVATQAPLPPSLAALGRPITSFVRLPGRIWDLLTDTASRIDGIRLPMVAAAWIALAVAVVLLVGGLSDDDDLLPAAIAAFLAAWVLSRLALPRGTAVASGPARWLLYPPAAGGLLLTLAVLLLWPLAVWIALAEVQPRWIEPLVSVASASPAYTWDHYRWVRFHIVGCILVETSWILLLAIVGALKPASVRWLGRPMLDSWQGGGRWLIFAFSFMAFAIAVGLWNM